MWVCRVAASPVEGNRLGSGGVTEVRFVGVQDGRVVVGGGTG